MTIPSHPVAIGTRADATIRAIHNLEERQFVRFGDHAEMRLAFTFELLVHPPFGQPGDDHPATVTTWLPPHLHFTLAVGTVVAVIVHPADPTNVSIDWWETGSAHGALGPVGRSMGHVTVGGWTLCGIDDMAGSAWPATGTIRSAYASGARVKDLAAGLQLAGDTSTSLLGGLVTVGQSVQERVESLADARRRLPGLQPTDPVLFLTVDVTLQTGATLQASCWHRVPEAFLPDVRPGLGVSLWVAPVHPTRHVQIVWP